ncbi:CobW/HypB/UreG, nucleotide-binding domain-containing protein [Pseudoneurospora amorphoporcata]|uniref:CobW/HypB/UreG, nucleotide-binding domain-containing protein n=1 Tax=Pseudoneurospora amorphoporcata TaxID=241081 RepID=A0AAN6SCW1_9PEZI|nr:CobW/HypB/UreG, nucleotide-binding domain-containing protein [Pseudoneurospora amorphoporcata]
MTRDSPIPITIITGFLGSGKTTLILNLLPQLRAANPTYRLALLKNEFGDLAVDSQLASSSAIAGVSELLNGCICCNLVGQLSVALSELQSTVKPDRIVIETSGSAFPATLALEVNRLARETGGQYVLDGVVSVIDVENWKGYEDTSYTAKIQARYTDLIVFNKWEEAGERRFDECLDRLGDLEGVDTAWVKSDKGWVGMDVVFGIDGGLARGLTKTDVDHVHDDKCGHDGDKHKHDHQTEVEVLSIELKSSAEKKEGPTTVNAEKLLAFLRNTSKEEVYRIKAVLTVSAKAAREVLKNSDEDMKVSAPATLGGEGPDTRYILNWAFGRWTFTLVGNAVKEHESSNEAILRMTMILARYESTKWKKRLEAGGLLELEGTDGKGELSVTKVN